MILVLIAGIGLTLSLKPNGKLQAVYSSVCSNSGATWTADSSYNVTIFSDTVWDESNSDVYNGTGEINCNSVTIDPGVTLTVVPKVSAINSAPLGRSFVLTGDLNVIGTLVLPAITIVQHQALTILVSVCW